MEVQPLAPAGLRRFHGNSYLADFTLLVDVEGEVCPHGTSRGGCAGGVSPAATLPGCDASPEDAADEQNAGVIQTIGINGDDATSFELPVHSVLLAAASPYFYTPLRGWSPGHRLRLTVSPGQLTAARVRPA